MKVVEQRNGSASEVVESPSWKFRTWFSEFGLI